MIKGIKITPQFKAKSIWNETIRPFWFEFQEKAIDKGKKAHAYMQSYINNNRKRKGGTGRLAKSINFEFDVGMGSFWFGIGNIDKLQSDAPYWYVVDKGKKVSGQPFIPGGGKKVPGFFGPGNPPNSSLRGGGSEKFTYQQGSFMMEPGPIRPMHFIGATRTRLNANLNRFIKKILKKR